MMLWTAPTLRHQQTIAFRRLPGFVSIFLLANT
jgi:hypothetical protein